MVKRFQKRKARPIPENLVLGFVFLVMLTVIGWFLFKYFTRPPEVTDFKSCAAAGQPILLSYPEQCVYNGQSFINPDQNIPKPY